MSKYCHCGRKAKLDSKQPAPPEFEAREVWVCSVCNKISHAVQEPVAVVRAPLDARHMSHGISLESGQKITTWKCGSTDSTERHEVQTVEFYPWPRRFPMTNPEPMIHTCWEQLMSKMPLIMERGEAVDPWTGDSEKVKAQQRAKYEARGMAELLATLMKGFIDTPDEVVKHAVKKYKDPEYVVPGLAEHLWDPMKNPDGSWRTPIAEPKSKPRATPKATQKKGEKQLSPAEIEGIRDGIASGLFTEEDAASIFHVSVEQVQRALAS